MRLHLDMSKSKQLGDVREGSYIKRVVTGTDKDGSPQYRYLRTQEEVDAWEANQSKKVDQKKQLKNKDLKEKVSKEHKESKKKQEHGESKKLLLDKKDKKVKKSLYVRKV